MCRGVSIFLFLTCFTFYFTNLLSLVNERLLVFYIWGLVGFNWIKKIVHGSSRSRIKTVGSRLALVLGVRPGLVSPPLPPQAFNSHLPSLREGLRLVWHVFKNMFQSPRGQAEFCLLLQLPEEHTSAQGRCPLWWPQEDGGACRILTLPEPGSQSPFPVCKSKGSDAVHYCSFLSNILLWKISSM